MATETLTATYRDGDRIIVEAEVDCLYFRYEFTDPDTEQELLWKMMDDERNGLTPVARYDILDKAQRAIDSGMLDAPLEYPLGVRYVGEAVCDSPVDDDDAAALCDRATIAELRLRVDDWKSLFGWSVLANGVLAAAFVWCWWRN